MLMPHLWKWFRHVVTKLPQGGNKLCPCQIIHWQRPLCTPQWAWRDVVATCILWHKPLFAAHNSSPLADVATVEVQLCNLMMAAPAFTLLVKNKCRSFSFTAICHSFENKVFAVADKFTRYLLPLTQNTKAFRSAAHSHFNSRSILKYGCQLFTSKHLIHL